MLAARGPSLLAIVVSGRATGRRAIIAVVDENYEVVYEEQVERFWSPSLTSIDVTDDSWSIFDFFDWSHFDDEP